MPSSSAAPSPSSSARANRATAKLRDTGESPSATICSANACGSMALAYEANSSTAAQHQPTGDAQPAQMLWMEPGSHGQAILAEGRRRVALRRRRHLRCLRSSSAVGLSTRSRNGTSGPE